MPHIAFVVSKRTYHVLQDANRFNVYATVRRSKITDRGFVFWPQQYIITMRKNKTKIFDLKYQNTLELFANAMAETSLYRISK